MSSHWSRGSRGPYRPKFTHQKVESIIPSTPSPPFGKLIRTLEVDELDESSENYANTGIRSAETVASFNWVDNKSSESTILVPGKPPLWTPQSNPAPLKQDNGDYQRDKNAARYPKHPTEPAVVVCLDADPDLSAKVDVMACASTLGNLLRFVRGQDKDFRMLVEKVGNTVFLVRRENSPTELIQGVRGFGHSFPEANTTWEADVKGSASHMRLVRYKFSDLDFLVRFGADGYIADSKPESSRRPAPGDSSIDDIVGAFSSASISSPPSKSPTSIQPQVGGSPVDHGRIFDLKTRSIWTRFKKDHLGEELPRLWIAQIPNFILAFHQNGLFKVEDVEIKDVREDVRKWEKDHAVDIARLAALIHRIIEMVSSLPGNKLELRHELGKLEVREQLPDAGDILSAEVRTRWEESSTVTCDKSDDDVVGSSPKEKDDGFGWDDESNKDFTACSAECGYCGDCSY